jgi:MGT family glycosyltransferase
MARITFLIEHEEGHLNPTFRLARRLQARGHSVTYLGLADGGNYVRAQGFEFCPILEKLVPAGTLRTQREVAETVPGMRDSGAEMRRTQEAGPTSIYRSTWRHMVAGDEALDRAMSDLRPDLLLLTSFFAPHALVLRYRYGVPIVLLTLMLRTYAKPHYAGMLGDMLLESAGAAGDFIELVQRADPEVRQMDDIAARMMAIREVILCPADLEIPAERHDHEPEVHYAEASVDLSRRSEREFPWDLLDPERKLLYVSLGSQTYRSDRGRVTAFLRATGEAFARRPGWQVVLATGGLLRPDELTAPAGTIVAGWAPQLDLLRRARVAITHGGLGTVKECIFFGVPMAVFPLSHDQPDNARRVVHHGLGTRGDLGAFTPETILHLVEIADHPTMHANVERMQRRFVQVEESGSACRLIEKSLPH